MKAEPKDQLSEELGFEIEGEALKDVQMGRAVCRALFTGLADVQARESLENGNE